QIKQVFSNFLPYSTNSNSNPNKRIVSPSLAPRSRKALSIPICRNCLAKRFTPSSEEKSVILNSFSTFGLVNLFTSVSHFFIVHASFCGLFSVISFYYHFFY